jgi:hypothetical protein
MKRLLALLVAALLTGTKGCLYVIEAMTVPIVVVQQVYESSVIRSDQLGVDYRYLIP